MTLSMKFNLYQILKLSGIFSLLFIMSGCSTQNQIEFEVSNPNDFRVENAPVSISIDGDKLPVHFKIVDSEGNSYPYQLDDLDRNGIPEELFVQLSLDANSSRTLVVQETSEAQRFDSKTDITIKVRDEADPDNMQVGSDFESVERYTETYDYKQDNGLIFLEGPGWESDLVGYRFYFDDRNRFDIFGKSTPELSLSGITENYHERRDWGADVLKVSSTLGIGTPAYFKDDKFYVIEKTGIKSMEVIADGPLRSILRVNYPEWEIDGKTVDAVMELEIHANHRYTELRLSTDADDMTFATGLVMHPNISEIILKDTPSYSYGYTWGDQTDLNEGLGMAVIIPETHNPNYEGELQETYTFSLNPVNSSIKYRFLAAWELEPKQVRITDVKEFETYIEQVAKQWQKPLSVTKK